MKATLFALCVAISLSAGYSQGQLNFNTFVASGVQAYGAPIYGRSSQGILLQGQGNANLSSPAGTVDYSSCIPLAGSGFTAQLWAGPSVGALQAPDAGTGTRSFSTVPALAGHLSSGVTAQYAGLAAGTIVWLQVRAWDNQGGTITSWAQVLANLSSGIGYGMSAPFQSPPLTVAPTPPPSTPGMTSFSFFPIPEPTVLLLGVLGAGMFFLRRRHC